MPLSELLLKVRPVKYVVDAKVASPLTRDAVERLCTAAGLLDRAVRTVPNAPGMLPAHCKTQ